MKTQPLRFTPYAWAQYVTIRDAGDTEVGAYGITDENDPLLVVALVLPKQTVSSVSVEVDGESLLDMAETMMEAGYPPHRWSRVWCHTHPGDSASPSGTDEQYFDQLDQEWSAMVILADGGESYCRFAWNPRRGSSTECESCLEVDYSQPFGEAQHDKWVEEYFANVTKHVVVTKTNNGSWPPLAPTFAWTHNEPMGVDNNEVTIDDPNTEEYCCSDCYGEFLVDYDDLTDDNWDEILICPHCKSTKTKPFEMGAYYGNS